jgi:hypothetical protein
LESQHVKCLTEGYLRGWLTFDYSQVSSQFRESLVINYIQEQWLYELLEHRLLIDTVLRSTLSDKSKGVLDPIFETKDKLVGLKLPSALPKAKISKSPEVDTADALAQMKAIIDKIKKEKSPDA